MPGKKARSLRHCSCELKSIYRPSVLSPELEIALERFLDVLWRVNPYRREIKWYKRRSDYTYEIHRKYVEIFAGHRRMFKISRGGMIYGWKARGAARGNVFDIVEARKSGRKILWDGDQSIAIEGEECGVCGRTQSVLRTILGLRCDRCRGSLTRHVNVVRRLGGVPMFHGRPVRSIVECR